MDLWGLCVASLKADLTPEQVAMWIMPLQALDDGTTLQLFAPNRFVMDWVRDHYYARIQELVAELGGEGGRKVSIAIGSRPGRTRAAATE